MATDPAPSAPPAGMDAASSRVIDDPAPPTESLRPIMSEAVSDVNGSLEDVFFGYNQFVWSTDAIASLRRDVELLRAIRDFPQLQVAVEGHCDERGSAEFNLGLGDRRACRTVASLTQFGLRAANLVPVS
jgi:peptidoglycan-associated lipoprotein